MTLSLRTDSEVLAEIASKVRQLRVDQNITQAEMAKRTLIPLATYRLFERTGRISLARFLAILSILGRRHELEGNFQSSPVSTLSELESPKRMRARG